MLIFCPDCQRQLRVPDSAAGKPVKCPACEKVFDAGTGASAEQIQAPMPKYPAPAAESFEPESFDDEPRRRRSQRNDSADIEQHDEFVFRGGGEEAQRRANSGAVWFYVAAGITLAAGILNTTLRLMMGAMDQGPFGPLQPEERAAGIVCLVVGCGGSLVAINVLIFIAGSQLRSFGVKGWVITGIVLTFVQVLVLGGIVVINLIGLLVVTREALEDMAPLTIALYGAATFLNLFAGVKAIMILNNEAVAAEFKQRRPRRRRRRRPTW
jgi:predicted Zn finger-like uncharacterized protein